MDQALLYELSDRRIKAAGSTEHLPLKEIDLDREDIYQEMIAIFENKTSWDTRYKFNFRSEEATGDGITQDAFSAFLEKALKKFDGVDEKVSLYYHSYPNLLV